MANPWEEYQEAPTEQEASDSGPWSDFQGMGNTDEGYRQSAAGEVDEWDSFWFSFNKMKTFTESAGDVMEQKIPLGRVQFTDPETGQLDIKYVPPSEELRSAVRAGDEEWAASILSAEREQRLMQRFPHLFRGGEVVPEAENLAGSIAGAVVDPTTLVPFAGGMKAAAAMGAGFGAADGYLYSKGKTGEADPKHVALGATIGAIVPPALKGVGRTLGFAKMKASQGMAHKALDKYEKEFAREIGQGVSPDMARVAAGQNSGLYAKGVQLDDLYKATGRTEPAFSDAAIARQAVEDIEQEAATKWLRNGLLRVGQAVEPFVGTVSTRIRNHSPKLFQAVRKVDLDTHTAVHKHFEKVNPFSQKMAALMKHDKGAYDVIKRGLFGEDFQAAYAQMRQLKINNPEVYGTMLDDFKVVRGVLDELYDGYKGAGYKLKKVKEYFPKMVINPEGIGVVRHSIIKKALDAESKRLKRDLTQPETARVINGLISRGIKDEARAKVGKAVRARKFDFMTEEMMPHYAEINDSLHAYIRQATHDIQRRKLLSSFGVKVKSPKGVDPKGGDLEWGLGELVGKEVDRLGLSPEQSDQLLSALRARFGKGEMASSIGIQHFKNISYGTTLGNVYSAITQFGDNAFGMYLNGVRNHLRAMFSPKDIKKTAIGLSEISEDLVNDVSKTKKFLDLTLKWSGFSRMDTFGKESLLNGAMNKYKKQLTTDAGRREFVAKWGKFFEGDMPKLMKQLKAGNFDDDNVRLLLWNTLADVQPIGLSEMPEKYLNHPNGRVFYMLKTFTIKQFDLMRREIFQQMRKGDAATAAKNAARFAILFGLINGGADAFKDFMSGKDVEVTDNMVENLVQLTGISRFQTSKMAKDGPAQVLLETLLPPVPFIDKPAQALLQGKPEKALETVPIVGKLAAKHLQE